MYPRFFQPTDIELFIINDKQIEIPKCIVTFNKWSGEPLTSTFGGKPIVSFENKPMFAELSIMSHFIADGWQSRWIETYGKSKKEQFV
ncbi:MAG: hypothetical protein ACR2KX_02380 [Chitinophagaceae bacterium]